MKQFSIHKVNKPMMRHKQGPAGSGDDEGDAESMKQGIDGEVEAGEFTGANMSGTGRQDTRIVGDQNSLLTAEEQEALKPKEIKVVNPWIHDATHKEYLESVKVSLMKWMRPSLPAVLFKYYFLGS